MLYYLNNCRNLDHAGIYGGDAIFDLWVVGPGNAVAVQLRPGDICWVASYKSKSKVGKKTVVLAKYVYTGKRRVTIQSAPGGTMWVLDGRLEKREVLLKADAAKHPLYAPFFNKVGQFKQQSVLRGG